MKVAFKIAVSPLVLGLMLAGCTPSSQTNRPLLATPKPDSASAPYDLAQQALQKGELAEALRHAERAVELSPRDVGYRMMLGDLYLKNGRFLSAEATFADVLTLNPGNSRAMFQGVLAQIAQGKRQQALAQLDRLAETAPAADVGLAYALAGYAERAVAMLEPAARSSGADARVRQNLALTYAMLGDWQRARVTASQDLSPADLQARMEQWAGFVQPRSHADQMASLLGVTPAEDGGLPVRLALAPAAPEPVAFAAVEPPAAPEQVEQASEDYAAVEASAPVTAEPAPVEVYAEAARSLVEPVTSAARVMPVSIQTFTPAQEKPVVRAAAGTGRYVVQLGAYDSSADVQRAWPQLQKRYRLDGAPVSAKVTLPGKGVFHRLAVGGFASQSAAIGACRSIKGRGGACFVRPVAGDAPIRLASRDTRKS